MEAWKIIGAIVTGLAGWWLIAAVIGWAFPGWGRPTAPRWEDDVRPADHPSPDPKD